MEKSDEKDIILKFALQNAAKFKGKASQGAVIGKIIAEAPELKPKLRELSDDIAAVIQEVNTMSPDEQLKTINDRWPGLLDEKEHKEHDIFSFLKISGSITTAFPPEPSKYPHIGHAKAILLNYELARRHGGKFILRFEDTNPKLAKEEYYAIHLDNYEWLGIKPDEITYVSDFIPQLYEHAERLILLGGAYVCTCEQETIRDNRAKGKICSCRAQTSAFNIQAWKEMLRNPQSHAVLRAKIDMLHNNSTMRDPTLFRAIDEPHPRSGTKYRIWPTYDFENAVMDGIQGVTHRLRSKEFEMRKELQRHLQKALGFKETSIFEFARFNLEGVESQGRVIREKIEKKELFGWDDPRLTTLVALRRRGFLPEAIKSFVMATGISKTEATLTWDDLIIHNKRLLDKTCSRYFFLPEPVLIAVKNAPLQKIHLKKHPEDSLRGTREHQTDEMFYINKADHDELSEGKLYRLMDCLNFRKEGDSFVFDSLEYAHFKAKGSKIMHFLPVGSEIDAEVLMADGKVLKGIAERYVGELQVGDVIQFERFGFCRLDDKEKMRFWYTHG